MAIIFDDMVIGAPPTGKINNSPGGDVAAPDDLASGEAGALPAPSAKTSTAKGVTTAPTVKTSTAKGATAAPAIITPRPADLVAPPFPLNHAAILWDNVAANGSTRVSDPGIVSGADNLLTPATYTAATYRIYGWIEIVLPSPTMIGAVALGAHSLKGCNIQIQTSETDGGPLVQRFLGVIGDNGARLFTWVPSLVTVIRLAVDPADGAPPAKIGVLYAGQVLQMQRPIFRGVEPATLNRVTEYTNNQSEGGQWLGRDITRQGLKTAPTWRNLSAAWVREHFDPFAQSARRLPFFYSWNPQDYPLDAAYCWTTGDIKQTITGPRDLMSVEMDLRGHA